VPRSLVRLFSKTAEAFYDLLSNLQGKVAIPKKAAKVPKTPSLL
jgi:hypothetical protein